MTYISEISTEQSNNTKQTKDMVLATNPLLESFGCAKTLRNNNSSRHGKYLEMMFNSQGEPVGAKITNYLLEKGRVVTQIEKERNFHVFYQICKSNNEKYKEYFGLSSAENYNYIAQSNCLEVEGIDDSLDYTKTIEAMQIIGIDDDEQLEIHRVLSCILWIGNILFIEKDNDGSSITDPSTLDFVAYVLQVDQNILEKTLTCRTMETGRGNRKGSVYDVPLNPIQAVAVRDALAKALYDKLFDWIIERLNLALNSETECAYVIGILDIYGFEIFETNSFEQLCINYVNEKLQQIFIELTLKSEQEEYVRENITWSPIKFFNNKIVCDLIESKRPPGIFASMNDACATAHADPRAADGTLIQRLNSCTSNPHLDIRGQSFVIKHYAGDVTYQVKGMTDKNKDQLNNDIVSLIQTSQNVFINSLFESFYNTQSKKRPPTASDKIKGSAEALVVKLMKSTPSYIRCIKPNANKRAGEYDDTMCLHQIKYLGLCENIRVRRAGFAYRQVFEKFVERFYLLSRNTSYAGEYTWTGNSRNGTETILNDLKIPKAEWQLGETKIFIKTPETLWALENLREKYWHNMASKIQRCFMSNKHVIYALQLRQKGHEILNRSKERRRFSLLSMRRFHGDYLNVSNSNNELSSVCNIGAQDVVFSCKLQVLISRPLRSSKVMNRICVLTNKELFIVMPVTDKKEPGMKLERATNTSEITKLSLSTLRDDWIILHVRDGTDLALSSIFKTEMATHIKRLRPEIAVSISQSIEYSKKPNKQVMLKFQKDESILKYDVYKSQVVTVSSGMPSNSESDPPCPRKEIKTTQPTPKKQTAKKKVENRTDSEPDKKEQYEAIYDYTATTEEELNFETGDLFLITKKEASGWWLGVNTKTKKEGWIPSNYLEFKKQIVKKKSPPLPLPKIHLHNKEKETNISPQKSVKTRISAIPAKMPRSENKNELENKSNFTIPKIPPKPKPKKDPKQPDGFDNQSESTNNVKRLTQKLGLAPTPMSIMNTPGNLPSFAKQNDNNHNNILVPKKPSTNKKPPVIPPKPKQ